MGGTMADFLDDPDHPLILFSGNPPKVAAYDDARLTRIGWVWAWKGTCGVLPHALTQRGLTRHVALSRHCSSFLHVLAAAAQLLAHRIDCWTHQPVRMTGSTPIPNRNVASYLTWLLLFVACGTRFGNDNASLEEKQATANLFNQVSTVRRASARGTRHSYVHFNSLTRVPLTYLTGDQLSSCFHTGLVSKRGSQSLVEDHQ